MPQIIETFSNQSQIAELLGLQLTADKLQQKELDGGFVLAGNGSQFATLDTHASFYEGFNVGTLWFWFKTSMTSFGTAFSITNGTTNATDFMVVYISGNTTSLYTDESLQVGIGRNSVAVLLLNVRHGLNFYSDNHWHHLAIITGDGNNRMIVDGVAQATSIGFGSASTNEFSNINNPNAMRIGNRRFNNTNDTFFTGNLDDIRFYTRALTTAEVQNYYNYGIEPATTSLRGHWKGDEGTGQLIDHSGNGKNSTANTLTFVDDRIYTSLGYAVSTNLVDGIPNVFSVDQIRIELAAKPATTSATIEFSNDLISWFDHLGDSNGGTVLSDLDTTLDLSALGYDEEIYYRLSLTGDNSTTVLADTITLDYTLDAEIEVLYDDVNLVSEDSLDLGTHAFGSVAEFTFEIQNTGGALLSSILIAVPTGYTKLNSTNSIPSGESFFLIVALDTSTAGTFAGDIQINSSDEDENPFIIHISAVVEPEPQEIEVYYLEQELQTGAELDLGVFQPEATAQFTFEIKNTGGVNLTINEITLPDGYTALEEPLELEPDESAELVIELDTAEQGTFSGDIEIFTNDDDENPFVISITALVRLRKPLEIGLMAHLLDEDIAEGRIAYGALPQGTPRPSVTIYRATGGYQHNLEGSQGVAKPKVTINSFGNSYNDAVMTGAQIRASIDGYSGDMFGCDVLACICDAELDLYQAPMAGQETGTYQRSQTFTILHRVEVPTFDEVLEQPTSTIVEAGIIQLLLDALAVEVFPSTIPQGTTPACVVSKTGLDLNHTLDGLAGTGTANITIECIADSYKECFDVIEAARMATHGYSGFKAGVNLMAVIAQSRRDSYESPASAQDTGKYKMALGIHVLYQNRI